MSFFFLALRLGHDDDRAVAAGITDQRQTDAGISGGALDNDPAGPEQPALLGVLDDVKCGAVLDRAAGVQKLCLAKDRAPGLLRGPPQFDQRRVADRPDKAVANFHLPSSSWRGDLAGETIRRLMSRASWGRFTPRCAWLRTAASQPEDIT